MVWWIPIGIIGGYVAKKIYDAATDDNSSSSTYSDNSAEREHEARQAKKLQDEQISKQRKHQAQQKVALAILKEINTRFIACPSLPNSFTQNTLALFANQKINNVEDAKKALSLLYGETVSLKKIESKQSTFESELNGLNQLSLLLEKV